MCVGMRGEDLDRLELPLLVPPPQNDEAMRTAFAMPVDLAAGTTTGIDAHDRWFAHAFYTIKRHLVRQQLRKRFVPMALQRRRLLGTDIPDSAAGTLALSLWHGSMSQPE